MFRMKNSFRLLKKNNPIFHYRFHKILSLDPRTNQIDTAQIFTPYLKLILILSHLTYTVAQAVSSMQVFHCSFLSTSPLCVLATCPVHIFLDYLALLTLRLPD